MPEKFFDEQTEQSEVKAALVAKYFPAYMGVTGTPRSGTAATASPISTCSPGRAATRTARNRRPSRSSSRLSRTRTCGSGWLPSSTTRTKTTSGRSSSAGALPGYDTLNYKPHIQHGEVGDEMVKRFEENKLVPTLFFVDPWGYKGMTLRLINSVLKDWGCDCCFFFNYSRVNAGLGNDAVEKHMDALFGSERASSLRHASRIVRSGRSRPGVHC